MATPALPSTVVGPEGGWCWYADPRALHHAGIHRRTYVGYITSTGEVTVAQYDHDSGQLTRTVLMADFPVDDHNNPSICVRSDGHLVVFWTAHSDPRHPQMYYRRSSAAEDIGSFEPVKSFSVNTGGSKSMTYANLQQLSAEGDRLYVFFRGANFKPDYTTTEGGDDWTPAKVLIDTEDDNRPYLKVAGNGVDRIHFAFTDGHPRNVHTSIFHMYYDSGTGNLHRADGSVIGPMGVAVHPSQADCVYDASGQSKAWIHDVAIDPDGRPVLVYANFPTDSDHRYRYARWSGSQWEDRELVAAGGTISEDPTEPNYSAGISLDHDDPSVVLLARGDATSCVIERWTTPDLGKTWQQEAITGPSDQVNARPFKPVSLRGTGPMSVLWIRGSYPAFERFETSIVGLS